MAKYVCKGDDAIVFAGKNSIKLLVWSALTVVCMYKVAKHACNIGQDAVQAGIIDGTIKVVNTENGVELHKD